MFIDSRFAMTALVVGIGYVFAALMGWMAGSVTPIRWLAKFRDPEDGPEEPEDYDYDD